MLRVVTPDVSTTALSGLQNDELPTVADVVALPAFAGARIAPRGASLDRPVRAVALSEGDAAPDSLLMVPGRPPETPPDWCSAVLARGAPGQGYPVPVIVLPAQASWHEVLIDLAALLGSAGGLRRRIEARAALREPLLAGAGHAALARVAAAQLDAPVACLDEYLDVLGTSGLTERQERDLERAVVRARGHAPAGVLTPFVERELTGLAKAPIVGAAGPVGVVVAWIAADAPPGERAVVEELADASALEHAREHARIETESRLRGELIEELLAGEVVSRESLVRRARLLGADLSSGAVAMIGTLQDPHSDGRLVSDERLTRRFVQQVRAVLELHWPRALVEWGDGKLHVLLPAPPVGADEGEDGVDERALVLARRLLAATRQTVPGLAVTLALSRHTPEPERLGAALDEAELALSIGERLGRVGDVVTFEETGTYKLLFQIFADRPEELSAFYEQTIAPLVRYDDQYQTELVGTLGTYLELDCNLAATAGRLYTHRHTVRYRLDRIAELAGLDIGKSEDREKLSLGLKAMRLLGRRPRTGPPERHPRPGRGAGH